jgi:hypothetical protein
MSRQTKSSKNQLVIESTGCHGFLHGGGRRYKSLFVISFPLVCHLETDFASPCYMKLNGPANFERYQNLYVTELLMRKGACLR